MGMIARVINMVIFFILVVFFSIINLSFAIHFFEGIYIILSSIFFLIFLVSIISFIILCIKRPNLNQHRFFKFNLINLIFLLCAYFISNYFPFSLGIFDLFNIVSIILIISYILFIISVSLFWRDIINKRALKNER